MQQVTENVYVQTGFLGCNASFIVTSEGVVMIDTPMVPVDALKWREEIAQFGPVRYLINTEPHEDHFTGNFFFEGAIIAHEGTREAIKVESIQKLRENLKQNSPESLPLIDRFYFRLPSITLSERLTLHLGKHTFQLINLPGHTPYQVAIFIPEEGVLFTTDNVLGRFQPLLRQALPYQWLDSLHRMEALKPRILVPGHGPLMPPAFLKESADFILEMIETVKNAISKGATLEEATRTISFADRYGMEPGCPVTNEEVQRWNVTRLYEMFKGS
jgi:cyclase